MALDVSVRSIEDMRNLSNDLKVLSDEMKETFRAAQKEVRSVEESWQDAQYLKFRDEFDTDVRDVERMSQRFREYAAHIDKLLQPLEDYKSIR
jgi:uncharacterized protein YukE